MADDLRQRIDEAKRLASDTKDRVLADRVPRLIAAFEVELGRLREENAYCVEALNGAEDRRQVWRERAEEAERERCAAWLTVAGAYRQLGTAEAGIARLERDLESARAGIADFRQFLDTGFRFWCSPNGVAAQYAKDLLAIFDRIVPADGEQTPTPNPDEEINHG